MRTTLKIVDLIKYEEGNFLRLKVQVAVLTFMKRKTRIEDVIVLKSDNIHRGDIMCLEATGEMIPHDQRIVLLNQIEMIQRGIIGGETSSISPQK